MYQRFVQKSSKNRRERPFWPLHVEQQIGLGLALLLWNSGPEVRNAKDRISSEPHPRPDAVAAISRQSLPQLLDAIQKVIAANDVEGAITRVEKYGELEYEPRVLITMFAKIVCQDNATEMHALKHHQATIEEFQKPVPAPFSTPCRLSKSDSYLVRESLGCV